jgi:hypothetical protein
MMMVVVVVVMEMVMLMLILMMMMMIKVMGDQQDNSLVSFFPQQPWPNLRWLLHGHWHPVMHDDLTAARVPKRMARPVAVWASGLVSPRWDRAHELSHTLVGSAHGSGGGWCARSQLLISASSGFPSCLTCQISAGI